VQHGNTLFKKIALSPFRESKAIAVVIKIKVVAVAQAQLASFIQIEAEK
jgi:hypothetical protein